MHIRMTKAVDTISQALSPLLGTGAGAASGAAAASAGLASAATATAGRTGASAWLRPAR
jgi:hypothetical protein